MKVAKTILNIIISFLLVLCLLSGLLVNILQNKVFDKNYIISKLEENEFYLQISREVTSGFEDYIYQSGLPEDTIEGLYTEEDIKNDVNSIIDYIYEGKEITLSDEKIKNNLDNKINEFLTKENRKLDKKEKQNVTKFETLIVNSYKNNVKVSNTLIETAKTYLEKTRNIFEKINKIPIIISVVLIIVLILINIKTLELVLNYLSISCLSTGILLKLFNGIIVKNVSIEELLILATSFSNLFKNLLKEMLNFISSTGTFFIIIGLTGIIIYGMLKSFKEKSVNDKNE